MLKYRIPLLLAAVLALPGTTSADSKSEDFTMQQLVAQIEALSNRVKELEADKKEFQKVTSAQLDEVVADHASIKNTHSDSSWTEAMRWKGDFRYRYESFNIEDTPYRHRNRVRARAALIADITPTIEVGLGLASGGDDPVSSNQTLGGGGSTKEIRMDLAYFDWSGLSNTHIVGGKFSNYIHKSGKNGLLWDGDWRPEGTGIKWDNGRIFANGLGTWIESDSKKGQSFAYLTQAGFRIPIGDNARLTAGVGYHVFDTKGSGSFFGDDNDFFGNSFNPVTKTYLHNYEELELFADLSFELFGHPSQIFGNFVQNQAVNEFDTAFAMGFKYGQAKNKGQWEFGYVYQDLEADSVLGLLTDSDFGGGGTDSKGHVLKGSFAIYKNFNAKFTYFINDIDLKSGEPKDFNRLQLDLSFKY